MNRLIIEQDNQLYDGIRLNDFPLIDKMKYDELIKFEKMNDLINDIVEVVTSNTHNCSPIVLTLVDQDLYFIWSISIILNGNNFNYKIYNWAESDKKMTYADFVSND